MEFKKYTKKKYNIFFHSKLKHIKVEWYFGNVCDYKECSYCLNKYTYNEYYRNMTKKETDKTIKFINSLKGVYDLLYIGGEPSTFKYLIYSIKKIKHNCRINIMSNAQNEKFIKKVLSMGTKERPVIVSATPHYEIYLKDKEKFIKHLNNLFKIAKKYKFGELEFNVLLDKEKTKCYKEMIEYLYHVGYKKYGVPILTSFVRRDRSTKETIKNFVATEIFDEELKTFMQKDLLGSRTNFLKCNKYYGETCPALEHYLYIRLDGKIDGTSCPQEIITKKSIFDDDFNLEEEKQLVKQTCICKHQPNNGICGIAHGFPP